MSTTDEDAFFSTLTKLRTEYSRVLNQNTELKAQLADIQSENSDLRLELNETRALLGKVMVSASKQPKNAVAGPSQPKQPERAVSKSPCLAAAAATSGQTQKRARSPSLEIVEQPVLAVQKKAENQKSQSQVYSISANEKPRQQSYPTPSSSGDPKRRRLGIESNQASSSTSLSRSSSTVQVPLRFNDSFSNSKPKLPNRHEGKIRVPESIIENYLSSSPPPMSITPPPLDLLVSRKFLRKEYGGSDQQFLQFIPAFKNPSGLRKRNMVFPMLHMNPIMPRQPGHAGLVFASRHEILSDGPWTVFCKPPETGKALWLYLGEYTNVLCGQMTKEEFGMQRDVVKKEWGKKLLGTKKLDVYVSMRARIALRKAGVLPVDDAKEEEILVKAEMDKVRVNKGTQVTEEDIVEALNRGDEGIDIIRMTCVTYDHHFANHIKRKLAEKKPKREQSGGGGNVDVAEDEVRMRRASLRKGKERAYDQERVCGSSDEDEEEDDDDTTYEP